MFLYHEIVFYCKTLLHNCMIHLPVNMPRILSLKHEPPHLVKIVCNATSNIVMTSSSFVTLSEMSNTCGGR